MWYLFQRPDFTVDHNTREAFGVRPACRRFCGDRKAGASSAHSKRFASSPARNQIARQTLARDQYGETTTEDS
jgi:hypothetical protein